MNYVVNLVNYRFIFFRTPNNTSIGIWWTRDHAHFRKHWMNRRGRVNKFIKSWWGGKQLMITKPHINKFFIMLSLSVTPINLMNPKSFPSLDFLLEIKTSITFPKRLQVRYKPLLKTYFGKFVT